MGGGGAGFSFLDLLPLEQVELLGLTERWGVLLWRTAGTGGSSVVGRDIATVDFDLGEATGVVDAGVPLPGGFGAGLFFRIVRTDGEGETLRTEVASSSSKSLPKGLRLSLGGFGGPCCTETADKLVWGSSSSSKSLPKGFVDSSCLLGGSMDFETIGI